jgi:putative phosphoesterase
VDVILHAGDIGDLHIITELETIAPVHAVHGNTDDFDIRDRFGEATVVELAGVHITIAHGHVLGSPAPRTLRNKFPGTQVIIYGHTHVPLIDRTATPLVVNPGAAGPARFNLKPSVAILDLPSLQIEQVEIG